MADSAASSSDLSKARRRAGLIAASAALAIIGLFVIGKLGFLPEVEEARGWLESLSQSPWGFPAVVLLFCVACYIGVPQFALIALTIGVFGPWTGALYAYLANLTSGTLTYFVGKLAGREAFERFAGQRLKQLSDFIARNTFWASAIVRIVPTGPFVLINTAFAAGRAPFLPFILGMAVGIAPKIGLIAFAGRSIFAVLQGNLWLAAGAAAGAVCVFVALWQLKRRLSRHFGQISPQTHIETVDTSCASPDR